MDSSQVRHNTDESRFEYGEPDTLSKLDYKLDGERLIAYHTEVPPEFEGMGVGSALVEALFAWAREQELHVVPLCPFVAAWLKKHPERRGMTETL